MKTQDLPKAREFLHLALDHPTTMGKDVYIREALALMKKTIEKVPVRVNHSDAAFKNRVISFIQSGQAEGMQDVQIAVACGATSSAAAARVSEYRNGVR